MNETRFEPYGSSFHPDWRESGVQLTGKQAVLLMHDIYKRMSLQKLMIFVVYGKMFP